MWAEPLPTVVVVADSLLYNFAHENAHTRSRFRANSTYSLAMRGEL